MPAKRKPLPNQLDLPVPAGAAEPPAEKAPTPRKTRVVTAAPVPAADPAPAATVAPAPAAAPEGTGEPGPSEIVAESVPTAPPPKPFHPAQKDGPLHARMDDSFLQYASYVIRDRAIPNLSDGLKPVQRRILWSLWEKDDGKFIKVATVAGHCMQYHPHGNVSIEDALVVLTNKRYLIEGQGNFGNVLTGDAAAAARYIECRLTELARTELFHDELTEFVPSYDGRNKEPVALPCKLPLLLMLGTEGIAVGLSSRILPHNFPELLEAQIAILKNQPFKLLPDFITGGLMDAKEYADGAGSVRIRARIKVKDSSTLVIKEIPPTCTSESLIASIEDAARKGKFKIRSISDFTAESLEIEVRTPQGVEAEQLIPALYAFTGCETSITSRLVVVKNNRPVELTVSQVLRENTAKLVEDLRRELELAERKLLDELHIKTLVRLFVENRVYKRIEQCKTVEAVQAAVYEGFKPLRSQMARDLTDPDVEMLLGVRIRRISLFDIQQHREEVEKLNAELKKVRANLKSIVKYAIARLEALVLKYKPIYPRLTRSSRFDEVEAREVAFKSFKVAYDREKGYLGHKVTGDEYRVDCSEFDKLLLVFRDGQYKVIELPEKLFVGPDLIYCALPERDRVMTLAYTNREATYLKRFTFGGTILNKLYHCIPQKSRVLFFEPDTPAELFIKYRPAPYQKINQQTCNPGQLTVKSAKAVGNQVSIKDVGSINSKPPRNWDPEAPTTKLQFL